MKFYFLLVCCWVWASVAYTQILNYESIFKDDYTRACRFFENNTWMDKEFAGNRINPVFARSIVFPEVLRFNALMDRLEMQGLFSLYVQYGKEYANFSVGSFQIKPSFAEEIELDLFSYPELTSEILTLDTSQTPQARLARVQRLQDIHWQVKYLTWFIYILDKRFKGRIPQNPEKRLLFYATSYNCGYKHDMTYIYRMQRRRYFHTELFLPQTLYNYASISYSYWIKFNTR